MSNTATQIDGLWCCSKTENEVCAWGEVLANMMAHYESPGVCKMSLVKQGKQMELTDKYASQVDALYDIDPVTYDHHVFVGEQSDQPAQVSLSMWLEWHFWANRQKDACT